MKHAVRILSLILALAFLISTAAAEKSWNYSEEECGSIIEGYEFLDLGIQVGVPRRFHHEWPTPEQMERGVLAVYWNQDYTWSIGVIDVSDLNVHSFEEKMRELKADPEVKNPEMATINGMRAIVYSIPEYDSFYVYLRPGTFRAIEIEYTPMSELGRGKGQDLLISSVRPWTRY